VDSKSGGVHSPCGFDFHLRHHSLTHVRSGAGAGFRRPAVSYWCGPLRFQTSRSRAHGSRGGCRSAPGGWHVGWRGRGSHHSAAPGGPTRTSNSTPETRNNEGSVRRRPLDGIDDDHLQRRLLGHQLQPELFLDGGKKRRRIVVRSGLQRVSQGEIVVTRQTGLIDDDPAIDTTDRADRVERSASSGEPAAVQ
jgi:hypothetical protein